MTRTEAGFATAAVLVLCGLMVTAGAVGTGLVGLVAAHRRAESAADLAALAGAAAAQEGRAACASADLIARANGARLVGCVLRGEVVSVVVAVEAAQPRWAGSLRARARSGPAGPSP
jgi:secretion/DNA translocation related TadE-like protein